MREVLAALFLGLAVFLSWNHICESEKTHTVPVEIERLIEHGRFDEAKAKLEEFRRGDPGNPRAIFYLARLEQDSKKALALFREVEILADSSLAAEAVLMRADINFIGSSLDASEKLYLRIVEEYPSSTSGAMAYYRLGIIRLVGDRHAEAEAYFENCIERTSEQSLKVLALAGIMECHVVRKDWEEVVRSAREVLEEDHDNTLTPRVLEVIAEAWHAMGNEENASHYTGRLLKHFPESYQAHAVRVRAGSIEDESYEFRVQNSEIEIKKTNDKSQESEDRSRETEDRSQENDVENAEFTVQASAFTSKNYALRLFRRLKEAKFNAHLSMKTVADQHFYLVQIGYFKTREDAEETAARVTEFTGVKANIIKLIKR